ncbi:hypothetical protein F5148DRAFT_994933 [Russula earlei]|uniref:Uncharacterized protein n=1 Tax=Russula earlei TaxID=71964 RepID=A0ACC0UGE0_9AGAM|nr:hypothetical protein F5148DRAFT_994933 [Russula earlei]
MLEELSSMDRITQLQDEIQNASKHLHLLTIMSRSIAYLTSRVNFAQVSEEIPITKQRNPDKVDPPDVFEANKKELVDDLMMKAKQIEYLIQSLPTPEPEEFQVWSLSLCRLRYRVRHFLSVRVTEAARLALLEEEMQRANQEYAAALARAKALHAQICETLHGILSDNEFAAEAPG